MAQGEPAEPNPSIWFGIDLGTTQSCIAYLDASGRPVVVPSAIGEDTTPSVVYFEGPQQVLVGSAAKNSAILAPGLTAQLVKRDMGKPVVAEYHGSDYLPEQLSALILRELVRAAKANGGHEVRDVVITVPAYFGIAEREATRRAGQLAGLTVHDLIAEPVAAAQYHQSLRQSAGRRDILVCDLGGGTFDTTVISVDGDDLKTICTNGDPQLGGADWDERIAAHLIAEFRAQQPNLDPQGDEEFMQGLTGQAEQVKKELSRATTRKVDIRFRGRVAHLDLTRETVTELTADLLDRVVAVTRKTVELAQRAGVRHFDEVILVGGMARVPAVAQRLGELLGTRAAVSDPDLAVARGAALYARLAQTRAALATGAGRASITETADQLGMSVTEVTALAGRRVTTTLPRAFGVMGVDPSDPQAMTNPVAARKMVVHLLDANTPLPADSGPFSFATAVDNQRMVEIEVWEQAGPDPSEELRDNVRVGTGRLKRLPATPAGTRFEVTFLVSDTGTLTVHASQPSSGAEVRFDLDIAGPGPGEMAAAQADIARHQVSG